MIVLNNFCLQEIPLFKGLSVGEIEHFLESTGAKIKSYPKGERVLKAFELNKNIGVLLSGSAQILALDRFGNESIGHTLERGAMFGITSAILADDAIATSIQLTADAAVMWIPYNSLLVAGPKLGRTHGIVMKNFLESFSRKCVLMMQKIELLSQKSLRERLILYLLQREKRQQSEKVKVPGRVQLAKELECNRSALTREISQMELEGIIELGENWMRLDKNKIS